MDEEDWIDFKTDLNYAVSQELNGNQPVKVEVPSYSIFGFN